MNNKTKLLIGAGLISIIGVIWYVSDQNDLRRVSTEYTEVDRLQARRHPACLSVCVRG